MSRRLAALRRPLAALRRRLRRVPILVNVGRRAGLIRSGPASSQGTGAPGDRIRERLHVRLEPAPPGPPRLNLLLPTLAGRGAFAGIWSALELFDAVGRHAGRRRIVTVAALPTDDARLSAVREVADGARAPVELVSLAATAGRLEIGPDDVLLATFWSTADLARRIVAWQRASFGGDRSTFGYLIQDFEPGFYPWSATWLLARSTYDDPTGTVAIFNTSLLQRHFHDRGIRFEHEFAFEPRLWPQLAAAMGRPPVARERSIVVYGRPSTPRNAFPLIVEGLRAWVARDPSAADWSIVSAGADHPPIDLGAGRTMESIGKLDLVAYGDLLRRAMIGISFMVSPHPSLPPLEMAHLGLRVLTTAFDGKDLAAWHENIESIADPTPEGVAVAIEDLTARLRVDPELGARGRPIDRSFVDDAPMFPFAHELADRLGLATGSPAPGHPTPPG